MKVSHESRRHGIRCGAPFPKVPPATPRAKQDPLAAEQFDHGHLVYIAYQGIIHNTRLALSPVGIAADVAVVEDAIVVETAIVAETGVVGIETVTSRRMMCLRPKRRSPFR